jgi:hypothetical protein
MNKFKLFAIPIGILAVLVGLPFAVMFLWNWLMPSLFGLIEISFWQALGIFVFCRILFGSFPFGHDMQSEQKGMLKKWVTMTPEQRKDFIRKKRQFLLKGDVSGIAHLTFGDDENTSKEDE